MRVAKLQKNIKLNPLLTFYKLKIFVCKRNSYGGFLNKELPAISKFTQINLYTLKRHIAYLKTINYLTADSTNTNSIRVRSIHNSGYNTGLEISNDVLLQMTTKKFKALLMELETEIRIEHNLRKTRTLNGKKKGCQLKKVQVSCSYQGLLIAKHKSTVSRWRQQHPQLYSNITIRIKQSVNALDHISPSTQGYYYVHNGVLYFKLTSLRQRTRDRIRFRRGISLNSCCKTA